MNNSGQFVGKAIKNSLYFPNFHLNKTEASIMVSEDYQHKNYLCSNRRNSVIYHTVIMCCVSET